MSTRSLDAEVINVDDYFVRIPDDDYDMRRTRQTSTTPGLVGSGGTASAENEWAIDSHPDLELVASVTTDKHMPGWWLPGEARAWDSIETETGGPPTKERPMTAEQLMRRERDFHLYGRGVGGRHLPDHFGRMIAFVVDGAMLGASFVLGTRALASAYPGKFAKWQSYGAIGGGAWVLLVLLPLLLWRATPGKLLLGLRIINRNGEESDAPRAMLRGVLMLVAPLLAIDLFLVLSTPHRRRVIDYLCGTRVVANY